MVALAWVGLGPPLLFSLASSLRPLVFIYVFVWAAGVASDFYTTYRFYRRDPENFERNELSGYMRRLYRAFGFRIGLLAFLLFVELPIASIVSFILVPASARALGLPRAGALECFASGLAFHGIMHFAAACWNILLELRGPLHSHAF